MTFMTFLLTCITFLLIFVCGLLTLKVINLEKEMRDHLSCYWHVGDQYEMQNFIDYRVEHKNVISYHDDNEPWGLGLVPQGKVLHMLLKHLNLELVYSPAPKFESGIVLREKEKNDV